MIKIVGCWDLWEEANTEYLIHWKFLTKHFGVDGIIMHPISGKVNTNLLDYTDVPFSEVATVQEVIDTNPTLTPVIIDENGDTLLRDFVHPEKALYIVGKTGWSPKDVLDNSITSVRIPSWSKNPDVDSLGLLNPHQAMSIVLYDRMNKLWQ